MPQSYSDALSAIARFNPRWRAFSHLAADAGPSSPGGPLHGLAVSVKGCIPVAGLPWTEGSAIYAGRIAQKDAAIVARARAAGAIVVGTTTLSELAMYGVENPFEPMGLNPWDPSRTAGGSSTGAGVAAALGMAQINLGTDSGGSIRNPACHCGVVGFMPSKDKLSHEGLPGHVPSFSTVGLIARTVDELEHAWEALAERPGERKRAATKVLLPRKLIDEMCDEETLALFYAALERCDLERVENEIPGWREGDRAAGIVSLAECGIALAGMDLSKGSAGIRARAANAARLSPQEVAAARAACAQLEAALTEIVVTPTWPFAAPAIHAQTVEVQGRPVPVDPHRSCFVRAANAANACAITLPMGLYPTARVPAGLHLMAPAGRERELLALAREMEARLPPLPPPPPLQ